MLAQGSRLELLVGFVVSALTKCLMLWDVLSRNEVIVVQRVMPCKVRQDKKGPDMGKQDFWPAVETMIHCDRLYPCWSLLACFLASDNVKSHLRL